MSGDTTIASADPSRVNSRHLMVRFGVAIGSLVLSLALAEVAVRIWIEPPACLRFKQDVVELQRRGMPDLVVENDPDLFWRLVPNQVRPDGGFPFRGVISNGQGLRADREIPLEKPAGEIRILFLGDSCTFGHGLLPSETFVYQVEQMLRAQFPQVPLSCINAGVPGYSLFQGVRFLETRGGRYHADLVVANFGFNDGSSWDDLSDLDHYDEWLASQPVRGLRWSRLCQMVWAAAAHPKRGHTIPRPRLLRHEFKSLLVQLHEVATRQGSNLLLLVLPYDINLVPGASSLARTELQYELTHYGQSALRLAPTQADGYVDLVPVLQDMAKQRPVPELLFDSVHPTGALNAAYARAIVAKLIPWVQSRLAAAKNGK